MKDSDKVQAKPFPGGGILRGMMRIALPFARRIVAIVPFARTPMLNVYRRLLPRKEQWVVAHGAHLLTSFDHGIGELLFIHGDYCPQRAREMREAVGQGDVAIDIGANIGFFTLLLAELVGQRGKVYAFEPDPRNYSLLARTIERNGYAQVIAEQAAVSNKAGMFSLYQDRGGTGNSLTPGSRYISHVEVPVVTLDEYMPNERNVAFVKMDMDGSEALAIEGMSGLISRSPNLRVLMEYAPDNVRRYLEEPTDVLTIAARHGLKLSAIVTETGRLPVRTLASLDLDVLRHLADGEYVDLLFTAGHTQA